MTLPNFRQYYQATIIKTSHWHKTRHKDQQNRTESPETNLYTHNQLIFNKGGKNMQLSSSSGVVKAAESHVNQ